MSSSADFRRIAGEGVVAFALHALLIAGGIALAGLAIDYSTIVVIASAAAGLSFIRFFLLERRGGLGYLVGAIGAAGIYPLVYALVDSADAGGADFGVLVGFLKAFGTEYVLVGVATLAFAIASAAGVAVVVRSARGRWG